MKGVEFFDIVLNRPNVGGVAPRQGRNRQRTPVGWMNLFGEDTGRERICGTPFQVGQGFMQLIDVLGFPNAILAKPKSGNKPRIANNLWGRSYVGLVLMLALPSVSVEHALP